MATCPSCGTSTEPNFEEYDEPVPVDESEIDWWFCEDCEEDVEEDSLKENWV
jgi:hypothetical protein